jgi:DNA-binding NtrC family response regulator
MATSPLLVVCDDDPLLREALCRELRTQGYRTRPAIDGRMCLEALREPEAAAAIIDLTLPGIPGVEVIRQIRLGANPIPVVAISGRPLRPEDATTLRRLGTQAFLHKPISRDVLRRTLQSVFEPAAEEPASEFEFEQRSPAAQVFVRALHRAIQEDPPLILLEGEWGSGCARASRFLHRQGKYRETPYFLCDTASSPAEALVHLFDPTPPKLPPNHVPRFLFVEQFAAADLRVQAQWLRAVRQRPRRALDPPRIASARHDLKELVRSGYFLEGLYDRWKEYRITVPPLRERRDDIVPLARRFEREIHGDPDAHLDATTEALLLTEPWPGNVSQLKSRIASQTYGVAPGSPDDTTLSVVPLPDLEVDMIRKALDATHGNQAAAARMLGLTRYALRYRLKKMERERDNR